MAAKDGKLSQSIDLLYLFQGGAMLTFRGRGDREKLKLMQRQQRDLEFGLELLIPDGKLFDGWCRTHHIRDDIPLEVRQLAIEFVGCEHLVHRSCQQIIDSVHNGPEPMTEYDNPYRRVIGMANPLFLLPYWICQCFCCFPCLIYQGIRESYTCHPYPWQEILCCGRCARRMV